VRAPVCNHDSVVVSCSCLSQHAVPFGSRISGPFGPVCGAGKDFSLLLMNTHVGYRRTVAGAE
jgi:hypothetical protein